MHPFFAVLVWLIYCLNNVYMSQSVNMGKFCTKTLLMQIYTTIYTQLIKTPEQTDSYKA